MHFSPQVITEANTNLVVIAAQEVVSQALAGREIPDVPVVHIHHRAATDLIGARPVKDRLDFGCCASDDPPLRKIRLKKSRENDAARVLPFLQRRLSLRKRCMGQPRNHQDCQAADRSYKFRHV